MSKNPAAKAEIHQKQEKKKQSLLFSTTSSPPTTIPPSPFFTFFNPLSRTDSKLERMEHRRRFYGRMVDGITYFFSGELTFSKKCEVHLFSFKKCVYSEENDCHIDTQTKWNILLNPYPSYLSDYIHMCNKRKNLSNTTQNPPLFYALKFSESTYTAQHLSFAACTSYLISLVNSNLFWLSHFPINPFQI